MSGVANSTFSAIATSAFPERRAHDRFPCPQTTCRISSTKEQTAWTARVVDLSAASQESKHLSKSDRTVNRCLCS